MMIVDSLTATPLSLLTGSRRSRWLSRFLVRIEQKVLAGRSNMYRLRSRNVTPYMTRIEVSRLLIQADCGDVAGCCEVAPSPRQIVISGTK